MALQSRKSRLAGPFLVSCIVCFVIVDFTLYSQTNSSPLSGLWRFLADLFGNFSLAAYLSAQNLFLLGAIVGLGIFLTRLSLSKALKAMQQKVEGDLIGPITVVSPARITSRKPKPLGKIFISYNRGGSDGMAHLLYERLNKRFPDRIMMDAPVTDSGVEPVRAIEDAVGSCDILLAIIGKNGLSATGVTSSGLSEDSIEIASALDRGMRLIPVLLQDTRLPAAAELPGNISAIADLKPIKLSDDNLVGDVERLIKLLEEEFGENQSTDFEPVIKLCKRYWPIGAAVALATWLLFMFAIYY